MFFQFLGVGYFSYVCKFICWAWGGGGRHIFCTSINSLNSFAGPGGHNRIFAYVYKLMFFKCLYAGYFSDVRKLICWAQGGLSYFCTSIISFFSNLDVCKLIYWAQGGAVTFFRTSVISFFSNSLAQDIFAYIRKLICLAPGALLKLFICP